MSVLRMTLKTWATGLCLLFALSVAPAWASSHGSSPTDSPASASKKKMNSRENASSKDQPATASNTGSAQAPSAPAPRFRSTASTGDPVSAAEIAAAKSSHKVWVNLNSGIYHKRGRWYGKTKNGKFMTEDEAKKAGYKAARRE